MNKGFALLFEMGLGKSLTAIAVAGVMHERKYIDRLLVIAPTSVAAVWPKEFSDYAAFDYTCRVLLGDKKKRLKALRELEVFPHDALKVAVINYEAIWRDDIFEALQEYDADMIICDESQRIKSPKAEQSVAAHRLGDAARYKMILSGTPVQNNALDIFSQYRFLDRTVFGENFYAFRARYAQMGGFNRKQVVGYKNLDELIKKEHSIAFRITKEEALDLPERTFETRRVVMGRDQKKLYDEIRRTSFAELKSGEQITATTVLTKILRLQQLAGGFLTADGDPVPQQIGTEKLDALCDIIEDYVIDSGKKLVVYARFIPEVKAIMEQADTLFRGTKKKAVAIYGDVNKEERGDLVEEFQTDPNVVLFIGQIDTAGTGITLTAADTCVYYSKNYNYASYEQSLSRIHRIGQRNVCTYISLVMEGTVDEAIETALEKKEDIAKTIVDHWQDYFREDKNDIVGDDRGV